MMSQSSAVEASRLPRVCRVGALADLAAVYEKDVQICALPRPLPNAISAYLQGLEGRAIPRRVMETVPKGGRPELAALPDEAGKSALLDDLCLLCEIVVELTDCDTVGVRLARVDHAMCPGWHLDRVGVRLVCTYDGVGTQWLADQTVDRGQLSSSEYQSLPYEEAAAGEIVLLKGSLWWGNETFGAIHRSPELPAEAGPRTVVTLDPLWLGD
mgnify:CR=1 FL=1